MLIEELKSQGMPVNGFLDKDQPVVFEPDGLTARVNAGRTILESVDFPRHLAELIQERTGSLPIVRMKDVAAQMDEQALERRVAEKTPAVQFKAKEEVAPFTIDGLALTATPPKLFHGKPFKPADLRPLNDLGDGGKVAVWGDVFATRGSRAAAARSTSPSITDYNGFGQPQGPRRRATPTWSKWEGPQARHHADRARQTIPMTSTSATTFMHAVRRPAGRARTPPGYRPRGAEARGAAPAHQVQLDGRLQRPRQGRAPGPPHWATAPSPSPTTASARAIPEAMLAADDIHKNDPDSQAESTAVRPTSSTIWSRRSTARPSMPLSAVSFGVFDTETTGPGPQRRAA